MDEMNLLLTEGVLVLIFGLVFAIVWVSILFHMIRVHTRIAEAVERMAGITEEQNSPRPSGTQE